MENIDISQQKPQYPANIDQIGLSAVELPVKVQWRHGIQNVLAVFHAVVSLDDSHRRGIHMSRIYMALHEFSLSQVLTLENLKKLLFKIVSDQEGISSTGRLRVDWKGVLNQKSLSGRHEGTRVYPCFYEIVLDKNKTIKEIQGASLLYSSTCPCSASLSRDLIQENFKKSNVQSREEMLGWLSQEKSITGTPHAQRSQADFKVKAQTETLPFLIQGIEKILATSVQSAVKREDEKKFAYLNAQNLMYSEDAIRRIKFYFDNERNVFDYWIKVSHFESLHPFDTSACISKNGLGAF